MRRAAHINKMRLSIAIFILFAVLAQARAVGDGNSSDKEDPAEEGEEVSNNLFSDLGPLLALFGEKVAQQFMSESMGWADHIIFAMAPLGMITALVGAIRVGGPSWLKAIIGRARENNGAAEVELQSSTSNNVCDLWNGHAIVRVMGSPEITELQLGNQNHCNAAQPSSAERKVIQHNQKSGLRQRILPRKVEVSPDPEHGLQSSKASDESSESINACDNMASTSTTVFLPSPGHQDRRVAPNMSLNATNDKVRARELWAAALFGTCLQAGVVIYWAVITYWIPHKFTKKNNERAPSYAFPLTAFGTLSIVGGLILCSYVVGHSTREEKLPLCPEDQGPGGFDRRIMWIQKGSKVSDQDFDSYVIIGRGKRHNVRTSRIWAHKSSNQERLTVIGAFFSTGGFFTQFMGFRSMHWSAAIAQLAATIIMMAVRAWVRRKLIGRPISQKLPADFELDWLASRYEALWQHLEKQEQGEKVDTGGMNDEMTNILPSAGPIPLVELGVMAEKDFWSERHLRNWNVIPGAGTGGKLERLDGQPRIKSSYAHRMMKIRRELGKLTQWESKLQQKAEVLERSITIVMDSIFDKPYDLERALKVRWCINVMTPGGVNECYLTINRNPNNGKWDVTPYELEAVLSLWVYSLNGVEAATNVMTSVPRKEDGKWIDPLVLFPSLARDPDSLSMEEPEHREFIGSARCLGPSTVSSRRDYRWWIDSHIPEEIVEIRESKFGTFDNFTDIDKYRIVGFENKNSFASINGQGLNNSASDYITNLSSLSRYFTSPIEAIDTDEQKKPDHPPATLALFTDIDVDEMCTYELFAQFMWAVARSLPGRLSSDISLQYREAITPTQAETEGIEKEYQFSLQASLLHEIAKALEDTGLGTIGEIYACIIPPLSQLNRLPDVSRTLSDWVNEKAKAPEALGDFHQAGDLYLWLFRVGITVDDHPMKVSGTVALVDFYRRLNKVLTLWRDHGRKGPSYAKMKQLRDKIQESLRNETVKEIMGGLARLYLIQRRLVEFGKDKKGLWQGIEKFPEGRINKDALSPAFDFLKYTTTHSRARYLSKWGVTDNKVGEDVLMWSSLHYVTLNMGGDSTTTFLKKYSFDVNVGDIAGWTPLHYAAWHDNSNSVQALLLRGSRVDAQGRDGMTPLHCAAARGHNQVLRKLLEAGASVEIQDNGRRTALHWSVYSGKSEAVDALLEKAAYVRARDDYGRTPLHYAVLGGIMVFNAVMGHLTVGKSEFALTRQEYLELKDRAGQTVLHAAARRGNYQLINAIIAAGGSADAVDNSEQSPFHLLASEKNGYEVLRQIQHRRRFIAENLLRADKWGRTPLHLAAMAGRVDMVKALLNEQGMIFMTDKDGRSAAHLAAKEGQKEVLKLLIEKGMEMNTQDSRNSWTPLQLAIYAKRYEIVKWLPTTKGFTRDLRDRNGLTTLHWVSQIGDVEATGILLDLRFDVMCVDIEHGRTALHFAAGAGVREDWVSVQYKSQAVDKPLSDKRDDKTKIARLLVEAGAVIDAVDTTYQRTALHWAALTGNVFIVDFLLTEAQKLEKCRLSVDARDGKFGRTSLHLAAREGHTDVVEKLLSFGADINIEDDHRRTALHWAVEADHKNIIEILMHLKPATVVSSFRHMTEQEREEMEVRPFALHWATWSNRTGLMTYLLEHRQVKINDLDEIEGQTPLHWAARRGLPEAVKLLLDKGANPLAADTRYGRTPLHWAVIGRHRECVECLLDPKLGGQVRKDLLERKEEKGRGRDVFQILEEVEDIAVLDVLSDAAAECNVKPELSRALTM